jgi:hypothetical protein
MRALIDYLRGCPTGFDQGSGLCGNVREFIREFIRRDPNYSPLMTNFKTAMQAATANWQHFSGTEGFPIASTDTLYTCPLEYYYFTCERDIVYTGEYGRRRIELANLIADELEKQLCKS